VYLDHVGAAKVPDDYEDRLTEMFPGVYKNLRICALDPYDLALAKLERNIQRDRDDVKHLARSIPLNRNAETAVGKRIALTTGNSRAGRFDVENVDRDARRGDENQNAMSDTSSETLDEFYLLGIKVFWLAAQRQTPFCLIQVSVKRTR
jgi:Nucleotidyltransferase of unknown function (DUF6036)